MTLRSAAHSELERQRAAIEATCRAGWVPEGVGQPRTLTAAAHVEARSFIDWLMEEIETGALHRMIRDRPAPDDAGIVWTTWRATAPSNL